MSRYSSLSRAVILMSALLALVMVPTVACAISTPIFAPWTTGGTASEPSTLTGYVKTAAGAPIEGVLVEISGETLSPNVQAQSFSQKALTGADGKFVITDVIAGTYSMYINQPYNNEYVAAYSETVPWHEDWSDGNGDSRMQVEGGVDQACGTFVLPKNGTVSGYAMRGTTPVAGSAVTAQITTGSATYTRWATTGTDGSFTIADAPAGDWSIRFAGSGSNVPVGAVPNNSWAAPGDALTTSPDMQFTLAEDETRTDVNCEFETGCSLEMSTKESFSGVAYPVGTIGITLTPPYAEGEEPTPYYLYSGDDGWLRGYLPVGDYHVDISDNYGAYESVSIEATLPARLVSTYMPITLTPAAGTFAVKGTVTGADDAQPYDLWVDAHKKDGTTLEFVRRVASEPRTGKYLIRLPVTTGYTGNKYLIELEEQVDGRGVTPEHVRYSFDAYGPADFTRNTAVSVGGKITGTVRDEEGLPVPGVSIAAWYKTADGWTGDENAWTISNGDGTYQISGLPANTTIGYKVLFQPYYDPGMALPEKYGSYYRRVYKGLPIVDSLVASASPVAVDHTPVTVGLNQTRANIDETITPGGYVALHTDGPQYPTGAVYCDVMYQVSGKWCEVDSGFTTGGTFQKIWKVLPTGHYRLDYSDYFGRGGGSWEFDLGAAEHKYASVLVPAPVVIESGVPTATTGAFVGTVGSGLADGGTGDVTLYIDKLASAPTTAPALSSNYTSMGAVYDFTADGTTTAGVWTLTIPYNPSVPDANVPNLRIRHFKQDGTVEMLVPFSWNLLDHTVKVQTASLSPFQVLYARVPVSLSTPVAPSRARAYRSFTVYGTLKPKHTRGSHSVQLKVYRYSSGKYRYYKTFSTTNSDYYSYTKYKGSVKLKAGKYRIYGYAPYDGWHLSTRTTKYDSVTIY